jgi:hypothetical protein
VTAGSTPAPEQKWERQPGKSFWTNQHHVHREENNEAGGFQFTINGENIYIIYLRAL